MRGRRFCSYSGISLLSAMELSLRAPMARCWRLFSATSARSVSMAAPMFRPAIRSLACSARWNERRWRRDPLPMRQRVRTTLFLTRIIGLRLGEVALRVLHEQRLGHLIAEAIGLAIERRVDGAIGLYVLAECKALRAHIVKLAGGGERCAGDAEQKGAGECRQNGGSRHDRLPGDGCLVSPKTCSRTVPLMSTGPAGSVTQVTTCDHDHVRPRDNVVAGLSRRRPCAIARQRPRVAYLDAATRGPHPAHALPFAEIAADHLAHAAKIERKLLMSLRHDPLRVCLGEQSPRESEIEAGEG